jgi:dimethylhistidine N-methyltransferase
LSVLAKPRAADASIADDVRRGLTASRKWLSPHLFYDDAGSILYEQITELPEYYPTRAEREIFETHADAMIERASIRSNVASGAPESVIELGAGSASKTEVILRALLRRIPGCLYVPIDVSGAALEAAESRLASTLPRVRVRPLVMTHDRAIQAMRDIPPPALVMFIGSSVGNFDDQDAIRLLSGIRESLGPQTALLLGTDLRKSASVLVPAYDDAAGVTAAFNKNVLTRINRELGGHFVLDQFAHVARWNDTESRIEMHLESMTRQEVAIDALGLTVRLEPRETIHTESSVKYTLPRVETILSRAGFGLEQTFYDSAQRFAVHLAHATLQ